MARYIDADELINHFSCAGAVAVYGGAINAVISRINATPTADIVPKSEVVKIFSIIDDIVESWKIEEHSKETGDLIRTSYNGTMIVKCLAELKKKYTEGP